MQNPLQSPLSRPSAVMHRPEHNKSYMRNMHSNGTRPGRLRKCMHACDAATPPPPAHQVTPRKRGGTCKSAHLQLFSLPFDEEKGGGGGLMSLPIRRFWLMGCVAHSAWLLVSYCLYVSRKTIGRQALRLVLPFCDCRAPRRTECECDDVTRRAFKLCLCRCRSTYCISCISRQPLFSAYVLSSQEEQELARLVR